MFVGAADDGSHHSVLGLAELSAVKSSQVRTAMRLNGL